MNLLVQLATRAALTSAIVALTVASGSAQAPIALVASPALPGGIAAFPRVAADAGSSAAARINRALASADRVPGCETRTGGHWDRTISVTMRGPRYLSLLATDDWYCRGAAHPNTDRAALVFRLDNGSPVDWKTMFRRGVVESAARTRGGGDGDPVMVTSTALWNRYARLATTAADKQCAPVYANTPETELMLWPDAKKNGLDAAPDWPHVIAACAIVVTLSPAQLRDLGSPPAFIDAIATAHDRGWYGGI